MGDYARFQNEIFEQLRELGRRHTGQALADFVKEAEQCGFTIDDLIAMSHQCSNMADFLRIFRDTARARGIVVRE